MHSFACLPDIIRFLIFLLFFSRCSLFIFRGGFPLSSRMRFMESLSAFISEPVVRHRKSFPAGLSRCAVSLFRSTTKTPGSDARSPSGQYSYRSVSSSRCTSS